MNKVCVKGQRIYFYRPPEPIPKAQVNFSKIEFDMDETWSSFLSVVAQFIQNGKPKNVQVEDGYCFVPSELGVGAFELCLRGDDGESVVASVNRLTLEVCEGFDPSGETPLPPSPDLYTQLIKEIDSGKKIAQSVREDADSGKFNGPPGKSPKIIDGTWFVWDTESDFYIDSGIPATGPKGSDANVTKENIITALEYIPADSEDVRQLSEEIANPDWNQNDPTKPDYVKNRPFGMIGTTEVTVVENQPMDYQGGMYLYMGTVDSSYAVVGAMTKVILDGTTYNSALAEIDVGVFMFGNPDLFGAGTDTGEPFVGQLDSDGNCVLAVPGSEGETHTISVYITVPVIKKLDEQYYDRPLELPTTEDNGKIPIAADGEWSLDYPPFKWTVLMDRTGDNALDGTETGVIVSGTAMGRIYHEVLVQIYIPENTDGLYVWLPQGNNQMRYKVASGHYTFHFGCGGDYLFPISAHSTSGYIVSEVDTFGVGNSGSIYLVSIDFKKGSYVFADRKAPPAGTEIRVFAR